MNRLLKRVLSCVLSAALMAGLCLTASAAGDFKFPNAYWPLQTAWQKAVEAEDLDQIISVAGQTYDLLTPLGMRLEVCANLWPKAQAASWACEIKGDINGAITWEERQHTFNKWLDDNMSEYDYRDLLAGISARDRVLKAAKEAVIYAQTDTAASPYPVGPRTGTWYGVPVNGSRSDGSAALVYIDFNDGYSAEYWLDYYQNHLEKYRKAVNGGVIELAWNLSPESTAGVQAVLSADSYISEGLRAMGRLNATVLLRVGAEMNNWNDCDPEVFKQAFRKVASAARAYSNIQMVFSPGDISNLNVSIDMYYPGDEYVDWVGMSTYHNSGYGGYGGAASSYNYSYNKFYSDAYYGIGIYDHDPLVTIKPIVDLAAAHNKPVMISECGFAYKDKKSGADLTDFANEQLNWFYSYVNMVYPQVKAVFYFDTEAATSPYSYQLTGSSVINAAYEKAIRENGAYLSEVKGTAVGWQSLDKTALTGSETTLRLAAYASLPGKHATTVKYFVDGKQVYTASQAPFYYNLDLSALTPGSHTIKVEAAGGQFKNSSRTYTLQVGGGAGDHPPVQPAAAEAMPTNDSLTRDGEPQNATVFKIDGSNYFKIRDLAAILNGTEKQFSVGYDNSAKAVTATSGQPYQAAGGELAGAASGGNRAAQVSNDTIYINGAETTVSVYKIDGSNYFKLRDLGKALNFYVGYDRTKGMYIETDKPYSE